MQTTLVLPVFKAEVHRYIVAVSNIPMVVQFCASFKDLDPKIYYTLCNASLARFMPYYSAITVAHDTFIFSA